ncbi:DUF1963 domain-containing protein [Flavobacterium chungangensis]|uniref:DUF1963 domain-containing protein n=1 Tax=Flavobacterium chungangensis TaxID=2708132 RepID=A0ABV8ZA93_9FLAO
MEGKQIIRITETIRFVSITLIVYWLYDFLINRGIGITETYYWIILGVLALMIGVLLIIILNNQTNIYEAHTRNVRRERRIYVSIILIFPALAMFLFGADYCTKFRPKWLNFSQSEYYKDSQDIDEIIESKNKSDQDTFFIEDTVSILEKYKKSTTLLQPRKSGHEISWKESKFGGYPNMESFTAYPKCNVCKSSLNFVFQIYKRDFPEFYFPSNTNIFQLFRCPSNKCRSSYTNSRSDHKMFHYYSEVECVQNKIFKKTGINLKDIEKEVPDCYLKPLKVFDYPYYDDYKEEDLAKLDDNFKFKLGNLQIEKYITKPDTKIGGYPNFIQESYYPKCKCGRIKEFLFQLSSDDRENRNIFDYSNPVNWSDHGIMIGDGGNIYYYICTNCGEKSIESYWDCS